MVSLFSSSLAARRSPPPREKLPRFSPAKQGRKNSRSHANLQPWRSSSAYSRLRSSRLVSRLVILSLLALSYVVYTMLRPFSEARFAAEVRRLPEDAHVSYFDLAEAKATAHGAHEHERVLLCVPLRDAVRHLPLLFSHLQNLTYPHTLLDLAFLVSDSRDNTVDVLTGLLTELQSDQNHAIRYNSARIYEKDFGQIVGQSFSDRHGFAAQASRRKLMGRARNWLLTAALRPEHSWVYWRDADILTAPATIIEDLMTHDADVIVPNVWRPLPDWIGGDEREQPYDLNAWQESEAAKKLAMSLDEDAVIVEGYAEYATWRPHLAYSRDPANIATPDNMHDEIELDGVGGVSLLVKASVFRSGADFPGFAFMNHAETEGFGKMCKRMGYRVIGLPQYVIWHIFEASVDDKEPQKPKPKPKPRPRTSRRGRRKKQAVEQVEEEEEVNEEDAEFRIPQVPEDTSNDADESDQDKTAGSDNSGPMVAENKPKKPIEIVAVSEEI
ncbi:Anp1-domain-containing protein [Limtongia smithiae]|uniref:Anp1-domain-containing protein n=1 Tax=Limtongia smithiae TaxID=1125753 RepID=UPI0034CFA248